MKDNRKNKITTLEQLEKEQEKLKMMMEVTRQEFAVNLGTNRQQLNEFLLKKVALPIGAASVGLGLSRMMSSSGSKKRTISSSSNLLRKLLPLGINLFQAYIAKQQKEKLEQPQNKTQIPSETKNKLKSVA